jgi:hypothetical protein
MAGSVSKVILIGNPSCGPERHAMRDDRLRRHQPEQWRPHPGSRSFAAYEERDEEILL